MSYKLTTRWITFVFRPGKITIFVLSKSAQLPRLEELLQFASFSTFEPKMSHKSVCNSVCILANKHSVPDLLTVDTLQHGELHTELGHVGLGGDLDHVGLTAVDDQLHPRNLLLLKYHKAQSWLRLPFCRTFHIN